MPDTRELEEPFAPAVRLDSADRGEGSTTSFASRTLRVVDDWTVATAVATQSRPQPGAMPRIAVCLDSQDRRLFPPMSHAHRPTRRAVSRAVAALALCFPFCAVAWSQPVASPAGVASSADSTLSTNLVRNPSFEQPAAGALPSDWHGAADVYSLDTETVRSGRASLKYVNQDRRRYALCAQSVPVQAGWKCRISAWIKTRDIVGDESGATICLEWNDQHGKYLGGAYPTGVKGTRDWTRVEAVTRLPDGAASCTLACYVRKEMTGTAWFDEVELVRIADPAMRTVLLSPIYRGQFTAGDGQDARVRAHWNLTDYDLQASQTRLRATLVGRNQASLPTTAAQPAGEPRGSVDLGVPLNGLTPGEYELAVRLEDLDGRELQTDRHRLVCAQESARRKCVVDRHRRLVVDGKPFFPLGMYWSSINASELEIYAQSKFNCLMPYGSPDKAQMDLAEKHGLRVIYSIKDWYYGTAYCPKSIRSVTDEEQHVRDRVRQYREHPALLAWYLNDELSQQYLPQLESHQRWVAEEDPDHPTWTVLYQVHEIAGYLNTFDVIGTDPYPIGRGSASLAAKWTMETLRQVDGARPVWQVPQLHNWANYAQTDAQRQQGRTPTYDEVRSMAWQCICNGATGLVFYSWFDVRRNPDVPFDVQWEGLKRVAAEIDRWAPIVLSVETPPPVKIVGDTPAWLHWLTRVEKGKLYLVAASDGDGEGEVAFELSAVAKSIRAVTDDRPRTPTGSTLRISLPRLDVQGYEIELATP